MSVTQTTEFRSRVERIENSDPRFKRAFMRDRFGLVLVHKPRKFRHRVMSILRIAALVLIAFSVFKAVVIHNDDNGQYAEIVAKLEAGDGRFEFLSVALAPDYFTEPLGDIFSELASKIEEVKIK